MSDTEQAQATDVTIEDVLRSVVAAAPATRLFVQEHYDLVQRSIVAGMGYDKFDAKIANAMMKGIEIGMDRKGVGIQLWILFAPSDDGPQFCGSITFFDATDAILGSKYRYIYSFHCSKKVPLEAWHAPFNDILADAKASGCVTICAKTMLSHVVEIAADNGFDVQYYLERTV